MRAPHRVLSGIGAMTADDVPQPQPSSAKPSMMEIILRHRDQEAAFAEIVRLYPDATID
jgi:hypothetical protein